MYGGGTNLPPPYKLTKYSQLCAAEFLFSYDVSLSNWYISIVEKTVELSAGKKERDCLVTGFESLDFYD